VTGTNVGNDSATDVSVKTDLPVGQGLVPGSQQIVSGAGAGALTDAAGDDRGTWDPASRRVTWQLGAGAPPTSGGTLAINESFTAPFHAVVGGAANGNHGSAPGVTAYTGEHTGDHYETTGSGGDVDVAGPDLALDLQRNGSLVRGTDASYDVGVSNTG